MATYSTNLALTLMATGEQSNTWGDTTNTNLGTLLEQAISGYVTQAITDGSGANTTITIPDGATGVARNMFIEMTGALTFATTSLIVPAKKKMYFIFNNTSGGFAVTVKVSGQTGILVPTGKKVILTCNGTDIVEAHTAIVGNATMGGTLGVTGATTLSSTLGVTGVATLGNGAVLGIPASGTVTNLTGTASININGTVGATTATTGAFTSGTFSTTLGVTGAATFSTGAFQAAEGAFTGVQVGTGSAGNQGWILGNRSSNLSGIWSTGVTPSNTNYSIAVDNGLNLYLNAATNVVTRIGNVGVTNVASTGLAVTGTLGVTGATGINGGNTAYGKFIVKRTAGTGSVLLDSFQVVPTTEAVLALYTSATAATIEAYNNAYLPISIGGGGAVTIPGTLGVTGVTTLTASTAGLQVYGFSTARGSAATSDGEVRLGGSAGSGARFQHNDSGNTTTYIDNLYDNAGSQMYLRMRTDGTPVNAIGITGAGAVTISGNCGTGELSVIKDATTQIFYVDNINASPYIAQWRMTGTAPNNTTNSFLSCLDNTTTCFTIWSNGTTSGRSDSKLKKNIAPVNNQLEDVMAMEVVNYEWNKSIGGTKEVGFIAQQVQGVKPGLVCADEKGFLHIKQTPLTPILWKAVQELAAKVAALEAK